MKHRQPRRLSWALLASVFLHALLISWVLLSPPELSRADKTSQAIEMDLVMVTPPAPEPAPAPVPEPIAPPAKPPVKQASKEPAKESKPVEASPAGPAQPEQVATAPSVAMGEQADSPRQSSPFLVPRISTVMPGLGNGSDAHEAAGRTVRNGPGEEPDPEALREYIAERAGKQINDQLNDLLAKAQRDNGLVNPYFTHLQADLREGFKGADVKLTKRSAGAIIREEIVETYTEPASHETHDGLSLKPPENIDVRLDRQ